MNQKFVVFWGVILYIVLPICMFAFVFTPRSGDPGGIEMNQFYHEKMEVLLESDDFKVSGNKATCYFSYAIDGIVKKGPFFTKDYIPMSLLAMKPEDARYIVRCNSSHNRTWTNYGRKHSYNTSEYRIDFEIYDRSSGEIIDTWSVVNNSDMTQNGKIQKRIKNSIGKHN